MAKRHTQTCPIAGFLNIFGDSWTLLILREAFYGGTRFSEFQRNTGIAKNLLSDRLSMLVEEGILEREDVGERGSRYAYKLTEKGKSLIPVYVAMLQWGNEHIYGEGKEPVILVERDSGKPVPKVGLVTDTGAPLKWRNISARPGPGANKAAQIRIAKALEAQNDDALSES